MLLPRTWKTFFFGPACNSNNDDDVDDDDDDDDVSLHFSKRWLVFLLSYVTASAFNSTLQSFLPEWPPRQAFLQPLPCSLSRGTSWTLEGSGVHCLSALGSASCWHSPGPHFHSESYSNPNLKGAEENRVSSIHSILCLVLLFSYFSLSLVCWLHSDSFTTIFHILQALLCLFLQTKKIEVEELNLVKSIEEIVSIIERI